MRPLMLMGTMAAIATLTTFVPVTAADGPAGASVPVGPGGPAVKACPPGFGGHRGGFMKTLNLSDEQIEKLHNIRVKSKTGMAVKRAELSVLTTQLREALSAENVDKQAAFSIQSKINALRADLSNARLASMIEKSEVFTAEQRKEIRHRMLQTEGAFGGRGGHGRGGFRHHR